MSAKCQCRRLECLRWDRNKTLADGVEYSPSRGVGGTHRDNVADQLEIQQVSDCRLSQCQHPRPQKYYQRFKTRPHLISLLLSIPPFPPRPLMSPPTRPTHKIPQPDRHRNQITRQLYPRLHIDRRRVPPPNMKPRNQQHTQDDIQPKLDAIHRQRHIRHILRPRRRGNRRLNRRVERGKRPYPDIPHAHVPHLPGDKR